LADTLDGDGGDIRGEHEKGVSCSPGLSPMARAGALKQQRRSGWMEPAGAQCGKQNDLVEKLVAGPGVYICGESIGLCRNILDRERTSTS
jgi:hypothetical protein